MLQGMRLRRVRHKRPKMRTAHTYKAESRSVAEARHYLAHELDGVAINHDAAQLLVSELATNAIEHARSSFNVEVEVMARGVRVEVIDDAPEYVPAISERPSMRGGFGLRLVDALAQRWGIDAFETHKAVWFELGLE